MIPLRRERLVLSTGVELDVTLGGPEDAPAVIFLHGFPESARTWRHQLDGLASDYRVVAPDQRGFARSSKPPLVSDYTPDRPVADLIALADVLGIGTFTLVGHDWGGAIAWTAALAHPDRIGRLAILNAPHPLVFQRSLIDDLRQRQASQYIRAFRSPGMEHYITGHLGAFFDRIFGDLPVSADARAAYLDEWSQPGAVVAMLNWYRATTVIVPAMDETPERPFYIDLPFPVISVPVLVIWGMQDHALTPVQLEGLADLVDDLMLVEVADAGHFVTWEKPEAVTDALKAFLARK